MRRVVRAGLIAALVALVFFPAMNAALAADKAFKQGGLDESAIKLEAQIKSDAGTVNKPAATLRRDADAAFQKNDSVPACYPRSACHGCPDRRGELAASCAHGPANQAAR